MDQSNCEEEAEWVIALGKLRGGDNIPIKFGFLNFDNISIKTGCRGTTICEMWNISEYNNKNKLAWSFSRSLIVAY